MAVYLIRAGDDGPVKIGVAANVLRRLCNLQTAHPNKLTIIRVLDGNRSVEDDLHRRFGHLHVSREWFTFHTDMLAPLGHRDLPIPVPPPREGPDFPDHPLGQYLTANGLTVEAFGTLVGVTQQAIYRYLNRERIPRFEVMCRMIETTKGEIGPNDFFISLRDRENLNACHGISSP